MKGGKEMKKLKHLFIILCAALLTFATIIPANAATKNVISKTKVRSIVRKNTPSLKGKTLYIELDTDDGVRYYDVTGKTSSRKYEFEIDAYSGKVLARSWESRKIKKGSKKLSKTQARKVVDKKVVARKSQKNYQIKTDYEKGVRCYEIEFNTSTRKYDVVVNATNGTIYEQDWELRTKKANIPSSAKISKNEAIRIVKNKFQSKLGLTSKQAEKIRVAKSKLEKDDGRYVYEIELRYSSYECEAEIDANSGKILDFEVDIDD